MIARRARLWTFAVLVLSLLLPVAAFAQTWQQLAPGGPAPDARGNHSAVYDAASNRMIIFGGATADAPLGDASALFGANGSGAPTWTPIVPAPPAPDARDAHSAIYDPSSGRMVIFGGQTAVTVTAEVWILQNAIDPASATWALALAGGPSPRVGHSAVSVAAQNRMVVFGGLVGPTSVTATAEVWVLDNADGTGGAPVFQQRFPDGTAPPARAGHTAIYDPTTGRMTVFGGSAPDTVTGTAVLMNDVWVLVNANQPDLMMWAPLSVEGTPPAPRTAHSAVYDPIGNRMLVFGGAVAPASVTGTATVNDLWELTNPFGHEDGAQPTWTQLVTAGTPPAARMGHSAVFDPTLRRLLVFGGATAQGQALGDTWIAGSGETGTLTVEVTGTGAGTVVSNPVGIDCPDDCSGVFLQDTTVTLIASPDAASTFAGWSGGDCAGTGPCTVTMTAAVTVTAQFTARSQATLTVMRTGSGGGTVTSAPAGIDCGADCSQVYDAGTAVTLTATPDASSVFAGWSGGCTGTDPSCRLTVTTNTTVTAQFDARPRPALVVTKTGTGTGTVTSAPAGIDCGADCTEIYDSGTAVTLTATPGANSLFAGWSGPCTGTDPVCRVTVTTNTTVTAQFTARSPATLTVVRRGNGTGTVTSVPSGIDCGTDCQETFASGTSVTLTATPAAGHSFMGWSGGGCTGTGACRVALLRNTTVTAHFAVVRLKVTKAGNGGGTVVSVPAGIQCGEDCEENYTRGTTVTLTATPNPGHTFVKWTGGGGSCRGPGPCTFTMPPTNINIVAHFAALTLKVTKAGSGGGTVTSAPAGIDCGTDCSEHYQAGTTVTLTATPLPGHTFVKWTGGGCQGRDPCTLTMPATNVNVVAHFAAFTLKVTKAGNGQGTVTSAPAGIDCGTDCSETYEGGTTVTLTAIPSPSHTFLKWTGGGCRGNSTCTVTIAANVNVVAHFAEVRLKVTKAGNGGGTVTSAPAGIDCGPDCSEAYAAGTTVTLTATPLPGHTFVKWTGGGGCRGSDPCTLTMPPTNVNVVAHFSVLTLRVTKAGSGRGTVTSAPAGIDCGPDCTGSYRSGTAVTLTATPEPGSVFEGWSGGRCAGTGPCHVTVTATVHVAAKFGKAPAFSFSSVTYGATERTTVGGVRVVITVKRTGSPIGPVSVDYQTSDGGTNGATAGADYLTASGTLTFGPGVMAQTFTVTILDDSADEPNETVLLTLSNATAGALVGTPSAAVLTIVDNDLPGPIIDPPILSP